ncbi:MAG: rRNA maturation RNase YbeY [Rhodobacteraceae bacterium]|jgi:probable rRNA maturation factor|nr:rRNA maturation RNase YbeY [Paracoccaceae bacterium]
MADLTETVVEDDRWDGLGLAGLADRAVSATLARLGLSASGFEVVVLGADDARIAVLNADFRGKPQPTNVLSWPSEERSAGRDGAVPMLPEPGAADDPAPLGDIALAWETCAREAEDAGRPMEDHVCHLIVHGTLHLLGYDHERDGDATLMERIEVEILDSLGVADPYS